MSGTNYTPIPIAQLAQLLAPLINGAVTSVAGLQGAPTAAQIAAVVLVPTFFEMAFVAWVQSLPTALPTTPGVAWNNGGSPAVS